MSKIYRFAALGTGAFVLFLWSNLALRWDALGIYNDDKTIVAFVIGSVAIWGGAFGWQWANAKPGEGWAPPRWLAFTLMLIAVIFASAAGRTLF